MGKVARRIRRIRQNLKPAIEQGLDNAALEAEGVAKTLSGSHWAHDSGSARDSITGFNPEVSQHNRNFTSARWSAAQRAGYVSPRHKNPHTNFFAQTFSISKNEDMEAYLTAFVNYIDEISSGHGEEAARELFMEVMDVMPFPFQRAIMNAVAEGMIR